MRSLLRHLFGIELRNITQPAEKVVHWHLRFVVADREVDLGYFLGTASEATREALSRNLRLQSARRRH